MQQLSLKQLFQLLLLFGKIENNHLQACLDLCENSVWRLRTTPSAMKFNQFTEVARLVENRNTMLSMEIGKLSFKIHSWNFNNIIRICMKDTRFSAKIIAERLGLKHQAFLKRMKRNSCSLHEFKKTIEAMENDLIFKINGNNYIIK